AMSAVLAYIESSPLPDINSYRWAQYKNSGELVSVEVVQRPAQILLNVLTRSAAPRDFALAIHDNNQNPLFTTKMSDRGNQVTIAGELTLSVPLPINHLRAGQYLASFASFTPNQTTFFDIVTHIPVQIISADAAEPDYRRWGQLCFDIAWSVHEVRK